MAEPDRRIGRAADLEGRPLPKGTVVTLQQIWTRVYADAARADRDGSGPAPIARFSKDELVDDGPLGTGRSPRAIDDDLSRLLKARWIERVQLLGKYWYCRVLNPDRRAAELANLGVSTPIEQGSVRYNVTNGVDPPPPKLRRSAQNSVPDTPKFAEISANSRAPSRSISLTTYPELSPSNLNAFSEIARERAATLSSTDLCIEIVSKAIRPDGDAVKIPATRVGVRQLARYLDDGGDLDELLEVLAYAPAIVAANLQPARYYGEDLVAGARFVWWKRAVLEVRRRGEREARRLSDTAAAKPALDAGRAAELAASLDYQERRLDSLARGEFSEIDRVLVEQENERMLQAVDDAPGQLAAIRAARERCAAEGRTWSLQELETLFTEIGVQA